MTQRPLAVRLPAETIDGLDRLVAEGWYVTRSACIKHALEQRLDGFERKRIEHVEEGAGADARGHTAKSSAKCAPILMGSGTVLNTTV